MKIKTSIIYCLSFIFVVGVTNISYAQPADPDTWTTNCRGDSSNGWCTVNNDFVHSGPQPNLYKEKCMYTLDGGENYEGCVDCGECRTSHPLSQGEGFRLVPGINQVVHLKWLLNGFPGPITKECAAIVYDNAGDKDYFLPSSVGLISEMSGAQLNQKAKQSWDSFKSAIGKCGQGAGIDSNICWWDCLFCGDGICNSPIEVPDSPVPPLPPVVECGVDCGVLPSVCGDGAITAGYEQCEPGPPADFGVVTCANAPGPNSPYTGEGTLDCGAVNTANECQIDASGCSFCGDFSCNGSETCGPDDQNGNCHKDCSVNDPMNPFGGGCCGDGACDPSEDNSCIDCSDICGNGIVGPFEQCDGVNLDGMSCSNIGPLSGGPLSCNPPGHTTNGVLTECMYDISQCSAPDAACALDQLDVYAGYSKETCPFGFDTRCISIGGVGSSCVYECKPNPAWNKDPDEFRFNYGVVGIGSICTPDDCQYNPLTGVKPLSFPGPSATESGGGSIVYYDWIMYGCDAGGGPVCGNNVKDGTEQCDGNDYGGLTCIDFGFDGGDFACSNAPLCLIDIDGCWAENDGTCESVNGENNGNSPADCPCNNNGTCNEGSGETNANCPLDCYCENGNCEIGEVCPADCGGGGGSCSADFPVVWGFGCDGAGLQPEGYYLGCPWNDHPDTINFWGLADPSDPGYSTFLWDASRPNFYQDTNGDIRADFPTAGPITIPSPYIVDPSGHSLSARVCLPNTNWESVVNIYAQRGDPNREHHLYPACEDLDGNDIWWSMPDFGKLTAAPLTQPAGQDYYAGFGCDSTNNAYGPPPGRDCPNGALIQNPGQGAGFEFEYCDTDGVFTAPESWLNQYTMNAGSATNLFTMCSAHISPNFVHAVSLLPDVWQNVWMMWEKGRTPAPSGVWIPSSYYQVQPTPGFSPITSSGSSLPLCTQQPGELCTVDGAAANQECLVSSTREAGPTAGETVVIEVYMQCIPCGVP